jgi:type I restriction enzyme M protein
MSSQASSAGRDEAKVRQELVETGDVDVMVAIRGNFFYTRTVPCELWFFDKAKAQAHRDHVLMLDARNVYRKVTRKIYDFSPEQLANLTSIVWLYRGQQCRFLALVREHLQSSIQAALASRAPLREAHAALAAWANLLRSPLQEGEALTAQVALDEALAQFNLDVVAFSNQTNAATSGIPEGTDNNALHEAAAKLAPLADASRDLIKAVDHLYKLAGHAMDACNGEANKRDLNRQRKAADEARRAAVDALKPVRYFHRQALWLQERFPEAELRDVPGLVKRVSRAEIEANDWSLTPGRYVGVAPEEVDEDFDFEAALRDIHVELTGLNEEAVALAAKIARNFEELGA